MSAVVYRYVNYRGRAVPLVPVGIRGALHWGRIWAYADSGAAYSLFDDSVAKLLGIDWPTGRPRAATLNLSIQADALDGDSRYHAVHEGDSTLWPAWTVYAHASS